MFRYSNLWDDINLCDNKPVCINIFQIGNSIRDTNQLIITRIKKNKTVKH